MGQQIYLARFEVHAVDGDQLRTEQAEATQSLHGAHAMLLQAFFDFVAGFVKMDMNRYFKLAGKGGDLFEGLVGNGIRSVGGKTETQQWVVDQAVANGQSLGKIIIGVGGVAGRELDDDNAKHGAHPYLSGGFRRGVGVEVHVVEGSDTSAQHFGAREQGAGPDEFGSGVARFGWPDTL